MAKKLSQQDAINEFKDTHGERYDYSKSVYSKSAAKMIITCRVHGDFLQSHNNHRKGVGCPKCGITAKGRRKRIGISRFIERSVSVHGRKYNYDRAVYTTSNSPIEIVCQIHGPFNQTPHNHIRGQGCPSCGRDKLSDKLRLTLRQFTEKATEVHGARYDYSKVSYQKSSEKVVIVCQTHGGFRQSPNSHLNGNGCPKCGDEAVSRKKTLDGNLFVERSKLAHGNRYCYKKVDYIGGNSLVVIGCPEHGEFEQTPENHLRSCGCPKCASSHGEALIANALDLLGIPYEVQATFPTCKHKSLLRFDFKITIDNQPMLIEYDGRQHFIPIDYFGGEKALHSTKRRDAIKNKWCNDNGIPLIRINYTSRDLTVDQMAKLLMANFLIIAPVSIE